MPASSPPDGPLADRPELRDWIAEWNPEASLFHGFDDAIIGVVERFGAEPVILYDRTRCIEILMEDGMSRTEAHEYFDSDLSTCCAFRDLFGCW